MLQGPEEPSSDWGPGFDVLLVCLLEFLLIYRNPGGFRPLLSDAGNFFLLLQFSPAETGRCFAHRIDACLFVKQASLLPDSQCYRNSGGYCLYCKIKIQYSHSGRVIQLDCHL